jgi:hypothetical protein
MDWINHAQDKEQLWAILLTATVDSIKYWELILVSEQLLAF